MVWKSNETRSHKGRHLTLCVIVCGVSHNSPNLLCQDPVSLSCRTRRLSPRTWVCGCIYPDSFGSVVPLLTPKPLVNKCAPPYVWVQSVTGPRWRSVSRSLCVPFGYLRVGSPLVGSGGGWSRVDVGTVRGRIEVGSGPHRPGRPGAVPPVLSDLETSRPSPDRPGGPRPSRHLHVTLP